MANSSDPREHLSTSSDTQKTRYGQRIVGLGVSAPLFDRAHIDLAGIPLRPCATRPGWGMLALAPLFHRYLTVGSPRGSARGQTVRRPGWPGTDCRLR
jgi:hypothetical protein